MDGSDINGIDVDKINNLIAVGEDTTKVSLYPYPCINTPGSGQTYQGHCSHVTTVKFTPNGCLLTAGGGDLTVIQWIVEGASQKSDSNNGKKVSANNQGPKKKMCNIL